MKIGQYDFSVKGKKAILTKEVGFYSSFGALQQKKNKHIFLEGTEVTAHSIVHGTGLTLFNFKCNRGEIHQFPVRDGKFKYVN